MDKEVAIKSINEMQNTFELDELFERLLVIDKIEQGRQDVRDGKTVSHEKAKEQLGKWLK